MCAGSTYPATLVAEAAEPECDPGGVFDQMVQEAPTLVRSVFDTVEVETWDGPLLTLDTAADAVNALRGQGLAETEARLAARHITTPVDLTKHGCLVASVLGSTSMLWTVNVDDYRTGAASDQHDGCGRVAGIAFAMHNIRRNVNEVASLRFNRLGSVRAEFEFRGT